MNKEKLLHDIFLVSIAVKGIDGILELLSGILLQFVKSDVLVSLVRRVFQHELMQDPSDIIANYLIQSSQHLAATTISFASIYLIIHGIIKAISVFGLLLRKLWAYFAAGTILTLFTIYQLIRFFNTHSILLLFLTLIDIIIIVLLRFEYKRQKKLRLKHPA